MSDSVQPHRRQPTRLLCPWDSPGKNTGVGCYPFPVHACMLSRFSCFQLCATLWTTSHQVAVSTGFSRQEYWNGLPFPSPVSLTVAPLIRHMVSFIMLHTGMNTEISGKSLRHRIKAFYNPLICEAFHRTES